VSASWKQEQRTEGYQGGNGNERKDHWRGANWGGGEEKLKKREINAKKIRGGVMFIYIIRGGTIQIGMKNTGGPGGERGRRTFGVFRLQGASELSKSDRLQGPIGKSLSNEEKIDKKASWKGKNRSELGGLTPEVQSTGGLEKNTFGATHGSKKTVPKRTGTSFGGDIRGER